MAVVLAIVVGGFVFLNSGDEGSELAGGFNQATPGASPPLREGVREDEDYGSNDAGLSGALPRLENHPTVEVAGSAFSETDPTHLISLPGWPFAFRVPEELFFCSANYRNAPEELHVSCSVDTASGLEVQITVLVRECQQGCDQNEQAELDQRLPTEERAVNYVAYDATTRLAIETYDAAVSGGLPVEGYRITMSHYFGEEGAEELRWQVMVVGSGPTDWASRINQTVNDIRTQTP